MPDVYIILYVVAVVAALAAVYVELRRDLMMLQQNSYRRERYVKWLGQSGDSTSVWRLCGIVVLGICLGPWVPALPGMCLVSVFGVLRAATLARVKYKKPLVMTARARRILATALALSALVTCAAAMLPWGMPPERALRTAALVLLALYCVSHIVILAANMLLDPVEKTINRKYTLQAMDILRSMPDLKIIGVTGSYGKTTTKHYLQRIFSEKFETLMTPGSFNTPLGVVRTIRENLKPYHEVFIVEMGAKNPGDIKEICDIVHPHAGIITAVGPQHLESFKTIEAVQATKFELADALSTDDIIVINNDFPKIADRKTPSDIRTLRYAVKNITDDTGYFAADIKYSPAGTSFTVKDRHGWKLPLNTPVIGECNISNVLTAVVLAHEYGISDSSIAYAVERLEQVEHRLSVKRTPGGVTIIDDAFNSNPVGSAMALEVLGAMTGGRRILITPGMIELGDEQEHLNAEFGRKAAESADIVIVVGCYNREAICAGLEQGGMPEQAVLKADSFAQAQQILQGMVRAGDVILYENDLPDTFK